MEYSRWDWKQPDSAVADVVYGQLLDDFKPEDIEWVMAAHWVGPTEVNLDDIDFSNSDEWMATQEPDRVDEFVQMIEDGFIKPIIVVDEPNTDKLCVLDGHHRLLAYKKLKRAPIAYVARVGGEMGPWIDLHSSQINGVSY